MTYTPVNNLTSMIMDFKSTIPDVMPASKDGSFTDVFKGQTQSDANNLTTETSTKEAGQTADEAMQKQSKPVKEIKTTDDAQKDSQPLNETEEKALTDEVKETLVNVVKEVASQLEVDEDEILVAMETLGLAMTDLLIPDNVSNVVLEASGEADPMALVTDENLANLVDDLNQTIKSALDDISTAFNVTTEEVISITNSNEIEFNESLNVELKNNSEETEMGINSEVAISKEEIKVTVDIQREVKPVAKEETEKTPVEKTDETLVPETGRNENTSVSPIAAKQSSDGKNLRQDANTQNGGNLFLQNIAAKVTETVQETTSGAVSYTEVRQVMNQVVESIHVSVKPETSDIEMMLHPEELGTVNVHLSSKEGVVTAQFTTQNEVVKGVLEAQMVQLKETFEAQGVKVENIEVQVQTNGFTQEYENSRENNSSDEENRNHRRGIRRINLNALEGIEEELSEEDSLAVTMMEANGGTVDYLA